MKKFLDLSSWRTALGNLLPSAHGHQGGSRKAAIGSMLIMAFAVVGCDDSSSASAGPNDEPAVESSSSVEQGSSSSEKAKSSSSDTQSGAKQSSSSEKSGKSSSSGGDDTSSSSVKSSSSSSVILSASEESSSSLAESSSSSDAPKSSSGETEVSSSSSQEEESSSSVIVSERWSWDVPKEYRLNPEVEYDSITDSRDGKIYKTVKIGDLVWMAENLNYADSVKTPSLKENSWCNNDESKNCDVAGRLYTWMAAMDAENTGCRYGVVCSPTLPVQGICPNGWHLPSLSEWVALFDAVGGYSTAGIKLKSQTGWGDYGNGDDSFGFSGLPAGSRDIDGTWWSSGETGTFWSSTEDGSESAFYMRLYFAYKDAYMRNYGKEYGYSVRCVKD
ncbi:MAG: fibrobacter succinogenes major paralogous domain-containing protein [Fibrobacter sp.]|uniref:fibrobacter succinogenes major paralogous domain-containing protein n=1 Tax=Fibrobacter sp. TaxID=35828 RepID=UPI002A9178D2|nr:fibrobacter succinogenes major paralogous domain-containing protein [Fibrobacter sp.]MDY6262952.1 fibrobacter succinogenes major paralogous domain-containing protein [Fibrobacter sp.]